MSTSLDLGAIVLLAIVAAVALAVAVRAIKNGKVGPQYGLSLKAAKLASEKARLAKTTNTSETQCSTQLER